MENISTLMKMLRTRDHSRLFLMLVLLELPLVIESSELLKEQLMEELMYHIKLKSSQDIPEQKQKTSQIKRVKLLIPREPKLSMMPRSTEQESTEDM
jgi:hypothetical protein